MLLLDLLTCRLYPALHLWWNLQVQNLVSQPLVIDLHTNTIFHTFVEAGIPYSLTAFAVNTAGNGERTTITNFTKELSKHSYGALNNAYIYNLLNVV